MRLRATICVLLGIVVILTAATAFATQVVYRSPQQMGRDSETVVRGKVVSVESYWNDTHTKIFTRTRVGVDETYKGTETPQIDIVQLGGVVDNVRVTVHGALQWRVGEEVLVFAERYDAATYRVSGFSQGKFLVERDPDTGVAYVTGPDLDDVELVGASAADHKQRPTKSKRVTLETFVDQALGRR